MSDVAFGWTVEASRLRFFRYIRRIATQSRSSISPSVTSKTERMIVLELSASCPGVELDAKVAVEVAVTELPTEVVEGAAVAVTAASAPT